MAKWNRGRKQRERKKFTEMRKPTPKQTISIVRQYQSPDELGALGPYVEAEWAVPSVRAKQLKADGFDVPEPIRGAFLLDTGAEISLINTAVIERLHLESVENLVGLDEGGIPPGLYWAELAFWVQQVDMEERFAVVRKFGSAPSLVHTGNPDDPFEGLLGVLGRDFLRYTHLSYDGPAGEFRLEILRKDLQQGSS
ncbi:MAG: hypothetical protein EP343_08740 [Deltaproteobacteria bacterium]|nr:MAG: hypothetical protein EP343_08740 [Deltaproteobacteria bacterium]